MSAREKMVDSYIYESVVYFGIRGTLNKVADSIAHVTNKFKREGLFDTKIVKRRASVVKKLRKIAKKYKGK